MYRLLGPIEVVTSQGTLVLGGPKQRALLGVLLLHANRVVSTDQLIGALWGAEAPATALNVLQGHIADLRRLLPGTALRTRAPGYVLEAGAEEVDAHEFQRLAREGAQALVGGDPGLAAERLRDALALWRGPVLAGVVYAVPPAEIRRLEELRLAALEDRVDADLALGRDADLAGELEALVSEHPGRERLCAQLMLALYRGGRQGDALAAYRELRARLADELGLDPSPDLQRLELAILRQEPSLLLERPPAAPEPSGAAGAVQPAAARGGSRVPVLAAAALLVVVASSVGVLWARPGTAPAASFACEHPTPIPAPRALAAGLGVLAHIAHSCDANSGGVWPRSAPARDSSRVPPALGDGTPVRIVCQDRHGGLIVDNRLGAPPAPPSTVWDRLDDGTWISDTYTTLPKPAGETPPLGLRVC